MTVRVVVAGAGAIGLSCAYFLQRAGCEVTVRDAGPAGNGASWGNAGWVSPSLSAPIPGPAAFVSTGSAPPALRPFRFPRYTGRPR
jgi:glycine/D-amino acid oxidase-like deaminating enzyme